jgi:hypothetical protein
LSIIEEGQETVQWTVSPTRDVAGPKGWREDLPDIGEEGVAVHGAVEEHRRVEAAEPESSDEGGRAPVAVGDAGKEPLTAAAAAAQPRQLRVQAARHRPRTDGGPWLAINEDQPLGVEIGLLLKPGLARLADVGAFLLARMPGLFFTVTSRRWKNRQSVPIPARTPRSAAIRSRISESVMSTVSSISPIRNASCASSFERTG